MASPANLMTPLLRGELTIPLTVMYIAGLTFGIVGWTMVLTWVFNNPGSVFWIIILHGLSNALQSYLILSSSNVQTASLAYIALPWAFAVYLLKRYGSETLTGKGSDKMASRPQPA